jgi:Sjoegren syndrome nuclear autoantigen 1
LVSLTATCYIGIEDLREKRDEVMKSLREDETEKVKVQQDLAVLTKRLSQLNESISKKVMYSTACSMPISASDLLFIS